MIPLVLAAAAAAGVSLSFDPPAAVVTAVPDTVTVSVTVDAAAADLRGFSLVVQVDSTVVRPYSVASGALLEALAPPCDDVVFWLDEPPPGMSSSTVSFDGAGLGCSVDGPGAIADLGFECLKEAITPLILTAFDLRDSLNQPITVTSTYVGTIQCGADIAVEQDSWGRVKARYRDGGAR